MSKGLEQRVEKLEKIVETLLGKKRFKVKADVGDTFELLGLTWKAIGTTDEGYMCLADRLTDSMTFDTSSNNWRTSKLRKYLNTEFYKKLVEELGEENIISFERNLLSMDGQTEYGTCEDKVSIIDPDTYRRYRKQIPNAGYWWWMLTPWSTPCNNYKETVAVVSPSGNFSNFSYYNSRGVRPFCIFSSAIFESEDK